jgi:hypothetical protein
MKRQVILALLRDLAIGMAFLNPFTVPYPFDLPRLGIRRGMVVSAEHMEPPDEDAERSQTVMTAPKAS